MGLQAAVSAALIAAVFIFVWIPQYVNAASIRDVSNWSPKMREPMEKMYGAQNFAKLRSDWVDVFIKLYHEEKGEICAKDLHKIQCPTFILHGAKDPMIANEHIGYLRKNIAKTEFFEFKDGKHNIHLRYADEFNKLVASFLLKHISKI